MRYNPDVHHRRSIRLPSHDYSRPSTYFVTLCVQHRERLFGEVVGGRMQLNGFGQIVAECWRWLPTRFPYVTLDEWVVMPNHLHGLLTLAHDDTRPEGRMAARLDVPLPKPLGRLIGAFKTVSTKRVNAMRARPGQPLWQRDFYERIVRGQEAVVRIRRYILNNPRRWGLDREAGTDVPL